MVSETKPAAKGLDYTPAAPINGNSYGTALREHAGDINTAHTIVMRRLFPINRPKSATGPWSPTCYRSDVLLPSHAPDACQRPQALCDLFETQAMEGLYSVAVIMTLRFPSIALRHDAWELHRAFARDEFVKKRSLPVVMAMHVPQLSSRMALPHTHLVILARRLVGSEFADFSTDLFAEGASVACAKAFTDFRAR